MNDRTYDTGPIEAVGDGITLDDVRRLAQSAHVTQTDKQGRDYYDAHLRPIAEACSIWGPEAAALGWMHDIVEDVEFTGLTFENLQDLGFRRPFLDSLDAVTRRDGEPYHSGLIARSLADPLARKVKFVDNAWNILCNADLANIDPAKAESLLNSRYLPARGMLLEHVHPAAITAYDMHEVDVILREHRTRLNPR